VRIESGTQVEVGKDWNAGQQAKVIEQLERFGGRKASEVSGRLESFPGIFYSSDRAISESQIVGGHEALVDAQEKRSATEATRSALGFDAAHRDTKRGKNRQVRSTEVEVTQDVPKNQQPTGAEVKFSVGVSEDGSSSAKLPV
jgi:hypothetical protein